VKNQHPVPEEWRDTFREITNRFVNQDYQLRNGVRGVLPLTQETSSQIAEYIEDYGEILIPLLELTWKTSVVQWLGDRWEVLVDLCTEAEGISDLVLHSFVNEENGEYIIDIHMVYVP